MHDTYFTTITSGVGYVQKNSKNKNTLSDFTLPLQMHVQNHGRVQNFWFYPFRKKLKENPGMNGPISQGSTQIRYCKKKWKVFFLTPPPESATLTPFTYYVFMYFEADHRPVRNGWLPLPYVENPFSTWKNCLWFKHTAIKETHQILASSKLTTSVHIT